MIYLLKVQSVIIISKARGYLTDNKVIHKPCFTGAAKMWANINHIDLPLS